MAVFGCFMHVFCAPWNVPAGAFGLIAVLPLFSIMRLQGLIPCKLATDSGIAWEYECDPIGLVSIDPEGDVDLQPLG